MLLSVISLDRLLILEDAADMNLHDRHAKVLCDFTAVDSDLGQGDLGGGRFEIYGRRHYTLVHMDRLEHFAKLVNS